MGKSLDAITCGRAHHEQGVAVGRRLGDEVGAEDAARADPVLDEHALATTPWLLGEDARQRVGAAATG